MIRQFSIKALIFLVFLFFFLASGHLYAQTENKNTLELKAEAAGSFDSGNYSDALAQYKSLLQRYPKDGSFSYYCGLSLLNMRKDIPSAIKYLEYASSKSTIPDNVFYYLGEAYNLNYEFVKARKAYEKFSIVASKSESKEMMPSRLAEMSSNAEKMTTSYNLVEILASSLFTFSDTNYIRQIHAPGGQLTYKPVELSPTEDGMKDISNLMFIPRNVEKGEILFYAAQSKNKKRGTDIYMVKTGNGHKYTEPVAVDAVNTEYDEIMPYYDPIGKDLFFASMGHNSMGGFDLFKAHYDAERNSWTDPVNLSFPVNSPSNEYLMIPGTDLGSIMLITDRQGADSMCTAFLLHIKEPRKQMAKADPVALKRIGNFGGLEGRPEMTDITTKNILPETRPVPKNTSTVAPVKQAETQKETVKMPADYNASLRLALDNQYKADSLSRLAQDARIQVKSIADPDERWVIQKDIISWEKQSSEYQAKADEYYLAVKKMEKENPGAKKIPGTIEKDTVINDITVYKFKQPAAVENKPKVPEQEPVVSKPEPQKLLEGEPGEVVKPAKETRSEMVRFAILDKSPYSSNNPFPEEVNYPKGAYYKIQLAAVSKDPEWDTFGGLSPVTAEPVTGKPMKRYYAGKFSTYESARTALEDVRRKGFPDAFVVGWYDGQKLTVSKVMDLEKK